MLYFQEPDIEPNYRINGVDLYTTDQTIQHSVKMQELQLETLRKQKKVTETSQREWQGLTDEERTFLAWESNNGSHCVAMTEAKLKEKNS
jgi:hypothetical protein